MMSFPKLSLPEDSAADDCAADDCGRPLPMEEPRRVGQFLAAVLARYGISAEPPVSPTRLPAIERQTTPLGPFMVVR